jgi:Flp pilus assembly protein TadD
MSVINRMLADLDERGERDDAGKAAPAPPQQRPRARSRLRALAAPTALALALVAVAAALIHQRAPALWPFGAGWASSNARPAQGDTGAPAPEQPPPRPVLDALAFEPASDAVTLRLHTSAAPSDAPAYERDGGQARLRLPLSGAAGVALPAPPPDQDIVRALRLEAADSAPVLHLELAANARLEVSETSDGYVVTAHAPTAEATRTADASDGGDQPSAADSDGDDAEPAPAEGAGETDEPDTGDTDSVMADAGDARDGEDAPSGDGRKNEQSSTAEATEPAREAAEAPDGAAGGGEATTSAAANGPAAGDGVDDVGVSEPASDDGVRADGQSSAEVRAQRRYRAARQALAEGELAGARQELRAALEARPDLHAARDLLVTLLRRAGITGTARDVLAEGLERAPERRAYAEPYARLLVEAGELERAAAVLERASGGGAADASYHALRGAVAQRLDRHEQAIAAYTRALEGDTNRGRWWLGLGISLAAADYIDQARSALREARATGDLSQRLDQWAQQRIEALAASGRE